MHSRYVNYELARDRDAPPEDTSEAGARAKNARRFLDVRDPSALTSAQLVRSRPRYTDCEWTVPRREHDGREEEDEEAREEEDDEEGWQEEVAGLLALAQRRGRLRAAAAFSGAACR
ncbi:MAG TPA: hypothetical protein VF841_06310 [Anaeromyxobacter sp.]